MKKVVSAILISGSMLFGASAQIHQGWNLVGAASSITPSSINSAKTIWTFRNGEWYLYEKDSNSANNYGFSTLDKINTAEGFWINATKNDSINFPTTQSIRQKVYEAYGLYLRDKKNDSRYTVSNSLGTNGVQYNSNDQTFELSAYKEQGKDSRASLEIKNLFVYGAKSVSVSGSFTISGETNSTKNRMQLNTCNIPLKNTHSYSGCAGISLTKYGAYVWFEKDNLKDYSWENIFGLQIGTEDMTNKNVTMKIEIDGTNIKYSISGDVNHEVTKDTASTNATIAGNIRYAVVRARVDDRNTDALVANSTNVKVSNITVEYAQ